MPGSSTHLQPPLRRDQGPVLIFVPLPAGSVAATGAPSKASSAGKIKYSPGGTFIELADAAVETGGAKAAACGEIAKLAEDSSKGNRHDLLLFFSLLPVIPSVGGNFNLAECSLTLKTS